MTVRATGPGIVLRESSQAGGGPSKPNNLGIVVRSISAGTAVLLLSCT